MFHQILSTIFFRFLLGLLNFALAILATQYLGTEGKGDVSLFLLNLTIVILMNNVIGGPYMVYLIPRRELSQLLPPAYCWAVFSSLTISVSLWLMNLAEPAHFAHLLFIGIMNAFFAVNTMVLLAKQEIVKFNLASVLQATLLIFVFFLMVEGQQIRNIWSYIIALYFSLFFGMAISFFWIAKYIRKFVFSGFRKTFLEALRYGLITQAANIAQLLNYRLSFYLLDAMHTDGRTQVGIYSVAVSVSEAIWLISHSVSLVQYARISNSSDINYSRQLTLTLFKITFLATLFILIPVVFLPSSLFAFIFGEGFGTVKEALLPLSPGILILAVGGMFSHFFSGTGKPQINTYASLLGLAGTLIAGFALIPVYGMRGAAITASISYTSAVIFQFVFFKTESPAIRLRDFIFSKKDVDLTVREIKNFLSEKNQ